MKRFKDPGKSDTLYILTSAASNSYNFLGDLYGILAAAGYRAKVCSLYKGSTGILKFYNYWMNGDEPVYRFVTHDARGKTVVENIGLEYALKAYPWTIFNMQEGTAPHRTTTPQNAFEERREAHSALWNHIRQELPDTKMYYQQIWSHDIGFTRNGYVMATREQQLAFTASIREYTRLVCQEYNLETIPNGDAWDIARENPLAQHMCAKLGVNGNKGDYLHDGDIGGGQYLSGCVWFETLTGESCIGNTFRPVYTHQDVEYTLSEVLIEVLQNAAHTAVENMRSHK